MLINAADHATAADPPDGEMPEDEPLTEAQETILIAILAQQSARAK